MKLESFAIILGYTVASAAICTVMDAGVLERMFGVLGVCPIGWYCGVCDDRERKIGG